MENQAPFNLLLQGDRKYQWLGRIIITTVQTTFTITIVINYEMDYYPINQKTFIYISNWVFKEA